MRKLFDGEPEFRIVEKIKDRLRSWVIPDVDGLIKELMVSRGGPYLKAGGWIESSGFILTKLLKTERLLPLRSLSTNARAKMTWLLTTLSPLLKTGMEAVLENWSGSFRRRISKSGDYSS